LTTSVLFYRRTPPSICIWPWDKNGQLNLFFIATMDIEMHFNNKNGHLKIFGMIKNGQLRLCFILKWTCQKYLYNKNEWFKVYIVYPNEKFNDSKHFYDKNVKINISKHLFDKMDKSKHFYDSCLLRIECSAYFYDPLQNNRCIWMLGKIWHFEFLL
jgi:hypothetical protein